MRVIVVNSGSSSIKYQTFALDDCSMVVTHGAHHPSEIRRRPGIQVC